MGSTYQKIAPTLALVMSALALCIGGALATGKLVITSPHQIKKGVITSALLRNGTVSTKDLGKGSVRTRDISAGAVTTSDLEAEAVTGETIEQGAVAPEDVAFPEGVEVVKDQEFQSNESEAPAALAHAGAYGKKSAESALVVTWTGTARSSSQACVFQLRVDGQPAANGAGEVYVPAGGQSESVSATATFSGLAAGNHNIEVWAHTVGSTEYPCTVGPQAAGVAQTFTAEEAVR